ncbi:uncharacterized protein LOC141708216 [Apium graveolens]|uniref:uncharacterized protein LOC141708216 n=1 Tax=Apium graveolens TaxID=4045 RepID=UPI003D7AE5B8
MILGLGNDVQDALVRQTIGIQPYLCFPRINDVPVQWVQLLNGFDQQDLYGWPLPTPLKVQMQKCDKCSREFCSPINYRRHIRVHRRSNVDKESHKNRDSLGAFWDKVSLDEAKKILSFEDVILEGVPGSSIIKALASFVRAPGFCALPQVYVKAGYVLLDVIEASPSRLPISSQEFFTVLDDASESTFLCGSAGSLQKFIFDGDAGKVGLEMKNLVACTSFLVEQNLVKAWIADKDAEALRCQKLLVEEEEAAQRRQAELLERKRLKKLRQKEQKTKGRSNKETNKLADAAVIVENVPDAEITCPPQSAGELHAIEDHNASVFEAVHVFNNEVKDIDVEDGYTSEVLDIGRAKNVELPRSEGNNPDVVKPEIVQKNEVKDFDVVKPDTVQKNELKDLDVEDGYTNELLDIFGAKNVELQGSEGNDPDVVKPDPMQKYFPPRDPQVDSSEIGTRKGTVENGRECVKAMLHVGEISQTDCTSCEVMIGSIPVIVGAGTMPGKCSTGSSEVDNNRKQNEFLRPPKLTLSSHSARAFLTQRWKEAISGDHETLVLSQEPEHQGQCDATNDDSEGRSILESEETRFGTMEAHDRRVSDKPSRKPKKGYLIKVQY